MPLHIVRDNIVNMNVDAVVSTVLFDDHNDGMENASHRYSYPKVKDVIEKKQRKGWELKK